ncbi:MAG: Crp/Fnr family transcriptional regulator [Bacteroidota bacterium]|jgi:CRP/FNR family cyclic AMP-dependent transcriptional regulator|nr:cyclic nucleotide-binding domain-containing protein [Algoriphagus sp.]
MRNPFSKTYDPRELSMFEFMQGIKFFETLKQHELARFLPTMHERKYVRDEVVFFSKDPSQALYLIRRGTIDLTIDLRDNFETIMQLKRGEAFGENSLLENTKRTYTALVTSDEAELLVIPHFAIQEIFVSNPKIKAKMMAALAEYFNTNNQRLFRSYRESFGFFSLRQMFE